MEIKNLLNNKIVLIPSAIFILIVGWIIVVYLPVHREIGALDDQLKSLEEKEKRAIPDTRVRMMRGVVDSLSSRLESRKGQIYPEEGLLDLGRVVEKIGKGYGLQLISIAPDYGSLSLFSEKKEEISELPMTIGYKGKFSQFTRFLDGISEFPIILRVNEVSMEKIAEGNSELTITLRGVIVFRKERVHESTEKRKDVTNRT